MLTMRRPMQSCLCDHCHSCDDVAIVDQLTQKFGGDFGSYQHMVRGLAHNAVPDENLMQPPVGFKHNDAFQSDERRLAGADVVIALDLDSWLLFVDESVSAPGVLATYEKRISGSILKPRARAHGSGRMEDQPSLLSRSGAGKANADRLM